MLSRIDGLYEWQPLKPTDDARAAKKTRRDGLDK